MRLESLQDRLWAKRMGDVMPSVNQNRLKILVLIVVLLGTSLACGLSSIPGISGNQASDDSSNGSVEVDLGRGSSGASEGDKATIDEATPPDEQADPEIRFDVPESHRLE